MARAWSMSSSESLFAHGGVLMVGGPMSHAVGECGRASAGGAWVVVGGIAMVIEGGARGGAN